MKEKQKSYNFSKKKNSKQMQSRDEETEKKIMKE